MGMRIEHEAGCRPLTLSPDDGRTRMQGGKRVMRKPTRSRRSCLPRVKTQHRQAEGEGSRGKDRGHRYSSPARATSIDSHSRSPRPAIPLPRISPPLPISVMYAPPALRYVRSNSCLSLRTRPRTTSFRAHCHRVPSSVAQGVSTGIHVREDSKETRWM